MDNPHFLCFSNEPDWLKANLKNESTVTFVGHKGASENERTIEDLWLMSRCKQT